MKKFDGIMICTDLDGTLLQSDKTISEENTRAIEYFKSEGGRFTFITGRMHYFANEMYNAIKAAGFRASIDLSDNSLGWKCAQYEMKGVPLRVELGPKDIENGVCVCVRRDNGEKISVALDELIEKLPSLG